MVYVISGGRVSLAWTWLLSLGLGKPSGVRILVYSIPPGNVIGLLESIIEDLG